MGFHLAFDMEKLIERFNETVVIDTDNKIDAVVTIQSYFRTFMTRSQNVKPKDKMTLEIMNRMLKMYNDSVMFNRETNTQLSFRKIRNPNFPSEISENVAKFALFKWSGIMGSWDTKIGDLELLGNRIEIKGFMSDGPISFGPSEKWRYLCIIDAKRHLENHFTVYLIKLSNTTETWRNIKVSKTQTYHDQCLQKRRPRLSFACLKKQINDHCIVIYDGLMQHLDIP